MASESCNWKVIAPWKLSVNLALCLSLLSAVKFIVHVITCQIVVPAWYVLSCLKEPELLGIPRFG